MKNITPKKGLSIVMKVSILAGSIAAMASMVVGTLIVNGSADIVYQNALNRLKYETNIKSVRLLSDIKNLRDDAKYLVATPPIMGIPRAIKNDGIDPLDNSGLKTWQNRLATIFTELIRAKSNYLQIRYIGLADVGRELLRVDRRGSVIKSTPEAELQQKGNTLYFNKAIKINPGEVYLSDVTLNREQNKISIPYTPVIRAATPVFFEGKLFGILVINMELDEIFNTLIKNTPRELIPYVTNEDGYFLAHPNKTMTYGFDLGHEHNIQATYNNFDLINNGDLRDIEFTVETKNNVVHVVKAHFDPMQDQRYFAVMLATSYKNLQSASDKLRYQSFIIMGILVTISLIIAAVLASRLMTPLKLISIASDDLANGREVLNLPVDSRDEIGELARSFDAMRHQLEEKKHELIVSQGLVHHSNKMASLGEMAGGMAHEINSPMQSISLIAQRVQRQLKKNMSIEDIDTSMEKITKSVQKISEIIDSLRKLSRDSTDDDFIDTSLGELVDDIVNMTGERFKVNNVKFHVDYYNVSKKTLIQCQRLQISQVLINLVNNSYDAIQSKEEKWITIDFNKANDKIKISITDSGEGIADDIIDRIFEPMFTTKEIGKGTGLGLSISNEIVLKHNGLFYVDKHFDNTRFVLELPITHLPS